MLARFRRMICAAALTCLLSCGLAAAAELRWDPSVYDSLVPADSSETIAPGTKITLQNWQRYKRFLPFATQVLFSGRYLWHVGNTPDFAVTVGPTQHVRLPRKFLEDTQKYGGQAKLERVDSGGFTITGYTAGVPFPRPVEPALGAKVLYNSARYPSMPAVAVYSQHGFVIDKFLNVAPDQQGLAVFRLSHLSVAGMPTNPSYRVGYTSGFRVFVTAPEQARYLTQLSLWPDDASLPNEIYLFLPALRRPLRLSSSARCAPIFGTDYANDDAGGIITNFDFRILGEKKILVLWHPTSDPSVLYNPDSIHIKSSVPGWPKPELGQWELREVYVLDGVPLPVMRHYCYGHRIAYIDKETWRFIPGEYYDADGKLWKIFISTSIEVPDNSLDGNYVLGYSEVLLNVRELHASGNSIDAPIRVDNDVPPEFRDASAAAFPASLHSIMR